MVNSQLPRVSYIKAVDLFFLVSFCFIFLTLVQYTLVLNLSSRARAGETRKKEKEDDDDEDDCSMRVSIDLGGKGDINRRITGVWHFTCDITP